MNMMAVCIVACQINSVALAQRDQRWQNCDMTIVTTDQAAIAKDAKAANPALSAALRANLLKRKAQLRGRSGGMQEASLSESGRVNEPIVRERSQLLPEIK